MDWTKPVFRTDLEFKTCYHTEGLRHADPGWDAYFADVIARDPMIQHSIKHANDDAYYAPPPLEPDVNDITNFVEALFARADEGTFVNLRAFSQSDRGVPPPYIRGVRLNGAGRGALIDEAVTGARFAANAEVALVFAPPVATFRSNRRAREADLANALSLSVELDTGNTTEARGRLEGLLGPCTVIVASGGEWTDPETGATFEKLHLHWRLSEPTREPADHARLKRVRGAACNLVNADRSATPPSHPLRWPGSWHLKGKPRLARIIALNPSAEISLDDAEAALGAAPQEGVSGVTPEADPALIASALAAIPNADLHWDSWIRLGLAVWRATGGSTAGFDAWRAWSQKSQKFTTGACEERWEHFAKSPPSKIGAGSIFYAARAAGWTWPKGTQSPVLRPEAPLESAIVFLNRDRIMHHLQGTFYEWQGTHYSEVAKEEMRAQLYTFLHRARRVIEKGTAPFDPTKFKVANVLEAVAAEAQLPSTTRPPMWLDDNALPPTELIACANGLLHFPKRALLSHSPAFFTLNALPFDYDPTAPAPAGWLTFLDQLWSKDQDTINTLQEIFGLLLTGDTRHEKAFLLVGPKRSGKGTIARILRKLIGPENVCGPTLSSLATTFGLMPLIGKRLILSWSASSPSPGRMR